MPASKTSAFFARFRSLIALVLMTVALSVMSEHFLTTDNGLTILRQVSINMCLSLGMTLVILSGGIDLSVGAILGFSGAVAAGLLKNGLSIPALGLHLQFTTSGAILAGVLIGAALGWHNGVAITRFRLPPFIATLGMLSIARGLAFLWTGGFPITGLGADFGQIGTGAWLGVPVPVWIMVVLVGMFLVVAKRTRFGRHLYAVGGNTRAARLTGLNVDRIKISVYTLAGALAGVAGLIVTSRLDSAQPNAGLSYELDAIAAVVIGGTSLSGGRGTILGTVLGCLIIGVLNNGLFLLNVSPFWQLVIKGYVILVAVAIDQASAPRNRDS
ncbi:MAG: ribose ABC transporter permease [Opitutaceae bacterium]|nr:ribose ABC transporter permease [Opitutaceae bacterium]